MQESISAAGIPVSVLIVNFRSTALLERCLRALRRSRGVNLEVVVTDNASPDFDLDRMRTAFDWVTLLR